MSSEVVSTVVPNIDVRLEHKDVKIEDPTAVTIRQWISTSYSNNQASFSAPPPSTSVFIDRCFVVGLPVTINYTGTTTSGNLLNGGSDALRAFPMASIVNSYQLTLNNQTFVIQANEIIPAMSHFWKQSKESIFPSMLDTYQNYADGVGAINNPLGQYFNAVDHHQPRGGFPMVVVNSSTSASINATVFEPVWLPVLHRDFDDGLGFTNIRTCDLVVNYASNLARLVSHAVASAVTLTSVSVVLGQPIMYQKYSSPPLGYMPKTLTYGTEDINRFITPCPTAPLTTNSSVTFPSTNIQLNCIPKWLLVMCRESTANLTYTSPDTYLRISALSINFNNVSGILSSASENDLFKISCANHLQDTWEQFHGVTAMSVGSATLTNQVGTVG